MQLPHPADVCWLAFQHRINPTLVPLLERVSRVDLAGDVGPLTPDAEQERQAAEAIWFHAGFVPAVLDWPWRNLQRLAGRVLPGEVWVVGARSGNGKSQWAANLIARLAELGRPRLTLAPLERKPKEFRGLWACVDLHVEPALAFKERWDLLPAGTRDALVAHMGTQVEAPRRDQIVLAPEPMLDRRGLTHLIARAAAAGHRLVIIDHLHQMDHGDGPEHRGIRETMKLAKRLAQEYDLAVLFTAQLNRGQPGDALRRFYPPEMSDLHGSSAVEHVADVVLMLYRPLRERREDGETLKKSDLDAVRMGRAKLGSVFRPHVMGVRCVKHRLDGEHASGADCWLHMRHGVIRDGWFLDDGSCLPVPEDAGAAAQEITGAGNAPALTGGPAPERGDAYEEED